jgi:hypothetical protein
VNGAAGDWGGRERKSGGVGEGGEWKDEGGEWKGEGGEWKVEGNGRWRGKELANTRTICHQVKA